MNRIVLGDASTLSYDTSNTHEGAFTPPPVDAPVPPLDLSSTPRPSSQVLAEDSAPLTDTSSEVHQKSLQDALAALSVKQGQALINDPFSQILKNNRWVETCL